VIANETRSARDQNPCANPARIVIALGGRAAEEIVFDTVTTGAANDIEQATKICRAMITQYGMSEKFGLMGLASQESMYLDGRMVMNCGDETATEVDHEVMKMLKEAYAKALELLRAHRNTLDQIADFLIRKETITGDEFMRIYRRVEGLPEDGESDKARIGFAGEDEQVKADPTQAIALADTQAQAADSLQPEDTLKAGEAEAAEMSENLTGDAAAAAEEPLMPEDAVSPQALDIRNEIRPLE